MGEVQWEWEWVTRLVTSIQAATQHVAHMTSGWWGEIQAQVELTALGHCLFVFTTLIEVKLHISVRFFHFISFRTVPPTQSPSLAGLWPGYSQTFYWMSFTACMGCLGCRLCSLRTAPILAMLPWLPWLCVYCANKCQQWQNVQRLLGDLEGEWLDIYFSLNLPTISFSTSCPNL